MELVLHSFQAFFETLIVSSHQRLDLADFLFIYGEESHRKDGRNTSFEKELL